MSFYDNPWELRFFNPSAKTAEILPQENARDSRFGGGIYAFTIFCLWSSMFNSVNNTLYKSTVNFDSNKFR